MPTDPSVPNELHVHTDGNMFDDSSLSTDDSMPIENDDVDNVRTDNDIVLMCMLVMLMMCLLKTILVLMI